MEDKDLFWLVGILEGEGYFGILNLPGTAIVSVQMVDLDIIERIHILLNATSKITIRKPKKYNHLETYTTKVQSFKAVELMLLVYPYMGIRRRKQIHAILTKYRDLISNNRLRKYKEDKYKIVF